MIAKLVRVFANRHNLLGLRRFAKTRIQRSEREFAPKWSYAIPSKTKSLLFVPIKQVSVPRWYGHSLPVATFDPTNVLADQKCEQSLQKNKGFWVERQGNDENDNNDMNDTILFIIHIILSFTSLFCCSPYTVRCFTFLGCQGRCCGGKLPWCDFLAFYALV